jgi:sugar lactone lactonase YvrE
MRDPNALGGKFMNVEDSPRLAARLGITALFALTAGCNGSAGAPPTTNTSAVTTQTRTASAPAHSGRELYVSTIDGGSVVVYSAGSNPTLLQTITDGVPRPGGIWVDKHGVLYAVNVPDAYYQTSLPEYKLGASNPFQTITDGIVNCGEVAVDSKGNVYVTGIDTANGSFFLEIYPKGKLSPSETLTIPHTGTSDPAGLAFDSTGALLVGESSLGSSSGAVYRLPAGSQTFTNLNLDKAPGGAIAVDAAGNLYVGGGSIAVYPPNSQKPARTINVPHGVSALTLGSNGELYVGSFESVLKYAPHAKNPKTTFGVPGHVGGLALSPQR